MVFPERDIFLRLQQRFTKLDKNKQLKGKHIDTEIMNQNAYVFGLRRALYQGWKLLFPFQKCILLICAVDK